MQSSASYDAGTSSWTLELRRLRNTGNPDDHSFDGVASLPPIDQIVTAVDSIAGAALYGLHCEGCHAVQGAGFQDSGTWFVPRVQRTSAGHILRASMDVPPMFSFSTLTTQEREDIAAYLQTQAIWEPEPVFVDPSPCGQTLQAIAGSLFSFTVAAEDVDLAQDVTLTATGTPPGATFTPTLPTTGNPSSAAFVWTPTNGDLGMHPISITATDSNGFSADCVVTVEVLAECYLVLAGGQGTEVFPSNTHTWTTQLDGIYENHAVLLDDMPLFPLPAFPNQQAVFKTDDRLNVRTGAPSAIPLATFTAQVLMWNPQAFPANPEQWTQGLEVTVWRDGRVSSSSFGSNDGMTITHEIVTGAEGTRWLRLPFSIEGL